MSAFSQSTVVVDINTKQQTIEGFGAALAYYENWLTAHPNKNEIYEVIFNELSLDILRVRNAYDYDPDMINRVKEFYNAAKNSLGHPIKLLSTSWGPPAYLKSNNDRNNGGTLKYAVNGGTVKFDYSGFANWWNGALDEYKNNGIYPDYISLQNEPDFKAIYESCLLSPAEKINSTDTIAGYNKALEAIYNMVQQRQEKPKILGPETIGIGYNTVQNYINVLNTSYLYGIAHHLYHGVDKNNPWISTEFGDVGNLHKELPHFQTEFCGGDWFSLAGLIYKSMNDENAVAYFYWDLIWDGAGLVSIEFPWDKSRWNTEKGYTKTKNYYAFKQFSAFVHPQWTRVNSNTESENIKALAFINPAKDSMSLLLINRSETADLDINIATSGFNYNKAAVYETSESEDCKYLGLLADPNYTLPKRSITTIQLTHNNTSNISDINHSKYKPHVFPNPVINEAIIKLSKKNVRYEFVSIIDIKGNIIKKQKLTKINPTHGYVIDCAGFNNGLYFFVLESATGEKQVEKFIIDRD